MKNICMIFAMLCMMAACATLTPEEKAAREAAAKEYIKKALVSQKYKINLTSIRPMRGGAHPRRSLDKGGQYHRGMRDALCRS